MFFDYSPIFALLLTLGVPVGLPPKDVDAALDRLAPEKALYFSASHGSVEAKASSTNHTEQLLAEPEVQRFIGRLDKQLGGLLATQPNMKLAGVGLHEVAPLLLRISTHQPWFFYVSEFKLGPGDSAIVRGGFVCRLGTLKEPVRAVLDKMQASTNMVTHGGTVFQRLRPGFEPLDITFGIHGDLFIVGVGPAEVPLILQRQASAAPQWLADLRKRFLIKRPATVTTLDIQSTLRMITPSLPENELAVVVQLLDLGNMSHLDIATGLSDDGYVQHAALDLLDEPGGLLATVTSKELTAEDLKALPANATMALAAQIDFGDMFQRINQAAQTANVNVDEGTEAFERIIGMRMREDFLAALGSTATLHTSPEDGGLLTGWTVTMQVKDKGKIQLGLAMERIRRAMEATRRNQKPSGFSQSEFLGEQIYSFPSNDFWVPGIAYCVTDTHVILAMYPQVVRSFLSRQADPKRKDLPGHAIVKPEIERTPAPLALAKFDNKRLVEEIYPWGAMFWHAIHYQVEKQKDVKLDFESLPSVRSVARHASDGIAVLRKTKKGIEFESRQRLPIISPLRFWILGGAFLLIVG